MLREAALNAFEGCENKELRRQAVARYWAANEELLLQSDSEPRDLTLALELSIKSEIAPAVGIAKSLLGSNGWVGWTIRQKTAQALEFSSDSQARSLLVAALKDTDNDVRKAAIHSLVAHKDPSCVSDLEL